MKLDKKAIRRFLRYSTVGVGTFGLDLALLMLLVRVTPLPSPVAAGLAFLVGVSLNYLLSRRFVFHGTTRKMHHGYANMVGVALGGAVATSGLVAALVNGLGLPLLPARVAVAGLVGIGNYLFNLYVNFKVVGLHHHGRNPEPGIRNQE